MDRIFNQSYIQNLCEELKQSMTELKAQMNVMESVADNAISAMNQVPSDVMDSSIESEANALKNGIANIDIEAFERKIETCELRATKLIPNADDQYREQIDELMCTIKNIREAAAEVREFLKNTPLTMSNNDFATAYEAMHTKCNRYIENADAQMDKILGNIKGAEKISTVFSKDPVNLSTGNFIYDHTDLEIKGVVPFRFSRFYNAINHRKGVLGRDWNHNYEVRIVNEDKELVFIREDGKEERFIKTSTGSYASVYHSSGSLSETEEGYIYETREQAKYYFDKDGYCLRKQQSEYAYTNLIYSHEDIFEQGSKKRLEKIERNTGEAFILEYDEDGYLSTVTDHAGRKVSYRVDNDILKAVSTPMGDWYTYVYNGDGKLKGVTDPRGILTVENEFDSQMRTTLQKFPDGSQMSYQYNDEKREIELTERNGSKVIYVHDENYRDIRHIYQDGEERFEYNKLNQKTLVVDKMGNKTQFGYDGRGNLTRIINALGIKTELQYNKRDKPVYMAVNGIEKVRYYYDEKGNINEVKDALGNVFKLRYDEKERPVNFIQPDGSELKVSYDKRGNIISLVSDSGKTVKYVYDSLNQVIETIDGNGYATKYEYDANGNVIKVVNAAGKVRKYEYNKNNKVTKVVDFDGSEIRREYNSLNLLSKSIDQLGRETNLTYDAMWNLARIVLPDGSKTTYLYDEYNRLGRIRNVNGDIVRYTYDANGNRIAVEDEEGNKTGLCYDALKRLTEVKCADGTKINYEYNCDGQVIKIWDSVGNYVCMIYNDGEQLVKEYNQAGESRDYTYTKLGKVETVKNEAGLITRYVYGMGGQLKEVIYPDGNKECYEYDANGNITKYTDMRGFRKQYVYDSLNQMTDIIDGEGFKKHYCYDSIGNVISETDEKGNKTTYEYSLTGKLIKVTDACGNKTEYQYDIRDELVEVRRYGTSMAKGSGTDVNCQITTYERNLMGQVTKITDSMGQSEILSYDKRGKLIEKIDREGYLTRYGYDVKGDLQHIQYEDGREVKLSYDALHQLQEVEDWLGITKIETDVRGNVNRITGPEGESIIYTYTPDGQRKSMTYPDNTKVEYEYDRFGRITALIRNNKVITYGYNASGLLCKKNYPNGMETTYSYTARGQIENLVHADAQGVLDRYTFQYDECGNKISVEKKRRGLDAESGFYQYSYDALGRIEQVIKDGTPLRSYTYDDFGNRTSLIENKSLTSYVYNDLNQLISKKDTQGETSYQYDRRGNLCRVLENDKVRDEYTYGAINRLEQMTNFKGQRARYIYNGLGYRVGKELQNDTFNSTDKIRYVLDFTRSCDNLLQKTEGNHTQNYFWDMGMTVLSGEEQGNEAFYLLDDLGSPIRLMNYTGDLIDSYGYDEFGRDIYGNQADKQPFGFTGYQYDRISELYFAQAREYDSSIGRFHAADPYKGTQSNADTLNAYLYCINNPLIYIDPWGFAPAWLEGIWVHMQIENELRIKYQCENPEANIRIPGAGLGPTGLGIADFLLHKPDCVEIYEIKPETWEKNNYLHALAVSQLERYVFHYGLDFGEDAKRGTHKFEYTTPYWKDTTRTLTYWTNEDGLIYYSLSPKPEPEPKPVTVQEPVTVPEKKADFNPLVIGTCTLATLYSIGTIAEDILTGGAGVADDISIPLVWSWALSF